jgi:hypothetical protein
MEDFIVILVDNTGNKPPDISISSHNSQDIVNGSFVLKGRAFDYDGLVESVDVRVDDNQWIAANNLGGDWSNWSFEIDSREYPNGTHNISVMAVDNATESRIIFIELIFKNNESNIDDPKDNETQDPKQKGEEKPLWPLLLVIIPLILSILMYALIKRKKEEEKEEVIEKGEDEFIEGEDLLEKEEGIDKELEEEEVDLDENEIDKIDEEEGEIEEEEVGNIEEEGKEGGIEEEDLDEDEIDNIDEEEGKIEEDEPEE